MNKKTIVAILVLIVLAVGMAVLVNNNKEAGVSKQKAQALNNVSVSACGTLSAPDTQYTLTADIMNTPASCFIITADNVILDGANHIVDGDGIGSNDSGVIATGRTNVTVENMTVSGFGNGVKFAGNTTQSHITNVHASDISYYAITLQNSSYNEVSYVVADGNANAYGIHLGGAFHNNLHNNETNSNLYGVYLEPWSFDSSYNTITDSVSSFNTGDKGGFYFDVSCCNIVTGNTANNNLGFGGFNTEDHLNSSNQFTNNIANNNGYAGIYLETSINDTLIGNHMDGNPEYGIFSNAGGHGSNLNGNIISNSPVGIGFENTSSNSLLNNMISHTDQAIYIDGASNSVTGGTLDFSNESAIHINGGYTIPLDNTFTGINITNTSATGHDITLQDAGINNTKLIDINIMSYLFSGTGSTVTFKKTANGEIKFTQPISGTGTNLGQDIVISNNSAAISESQVGLNHSADISLYNIPAGTNYRVVRDGVPCSSTVCSVVVVSNGGVATFSVTGAGTYVVAWDPAVNPNIPTVSITSPTSNILPHNGSVKVTAIATAPLGLQSVKISIDSVLKKTCGAPTPSPCTYTWPMSQVTNGIHTITATATDSSPAHLTQTTTMSVVK